MPICSTLPNSLKGDPVAIPGSPDRVRQFDAGFPGGSGVGGDREHGGGGDRRGSGRGRTAGRFRPAGGGRLHRRRVEAGRRVRIRWKAPRRRAGWRSSRRRRSSAGSRRRPSSVPRTPTRPIRWRLDAYEGLARPSCGAFGESRGPTPWPALPDAESRRAGAARRSSRSWPSAENVGRVAGDRAARRIWAFFVPADGIGWDRTTSPPAPPPADEIRAGYQPSADPTADPELRRIDGMLQAIITGKPVEDWQLADVRADYREAVEVSPRVGGCR